MNVNVGSFVRIGLGVLSGHLAKKGIDVDDGTVEVVAAAERRDCRCVGGDEK